MGAWLWIDVIAAIRKGCQDELQALPGGELQANQISTMLSNNNNNKSILLEASLGFFLSLVSSELWPREGRRRRRRRGRGGE